MPLTENPRTGRSPTSGRDNGACCAAEGAEHSKRDESRNKTIQGTKLETRRIVHPFPSCERLSFETSASAKSSRGYRWAPIRDTTLPVSDCNVMIRSSVKGTPRVLTVKMYDHTGMGF